MCKKKEKQRISLIEMLNDIRPTEVVESNDKIEAGFNFWYWLIRFLRRDKNIPSLSVTLTITSNTELG